MASLIKHCHPVIQMNGNIRACFGTTSSAWLCGLLGARLLSLLCLAALVGGCALTFSPPEHRAQQYSTAFGSYPAQTQERLRAAAIATGDDRTAVYIALGNPHKRRMGYGRDATTGALVLLEYWDYSGYPTLEREGQFVTLNNGGFASPLADQSYGKVTVEFADARVRSYVYDPDSAVSVHYGGQMSVPRDPHE